MLRDGHCPPMRLMLVVLLALIIRNAPPASGRTYDPVADPEAVVLVDQARFTVLTPQLIRMEWSSDARFEDHASLVFINRRLPVPPFNAYSDGDWFTLDTEKLIVKYKKNSGKFAGHNLSVELLLNGKKITWSPGTEDEGNLQGTMRTLDGVRGGASLEQGLLSRNGWVLIDDSDRPLFDNSQWPWAMPRPEGDRQDWYFL
ncbi:MAG: hypothetical protein KAY24_18730, partial [Candidatus Eisenbacteria sp.]|nr:hypothetical protein [Candidatus Eisenbacteria bacterium]